MWLPSNLKMTDVEVRRFQIQIQSGWKKTVRAFRKFCKEKGLSFKLSMTITEASLELENFRKLLKVIKGSNLPDRSKQKFEQISIVCIEHIEAVLKRKSWAPGDLARDGFRIDKSKSGKDFVRVKN